MERDVTTLKRTLDFLDSNSHRSPQIKAFTDPRGFDATECWNDEWRSQLVEIEVMVALMIVRLANGSFPSQNIVPVMLFSYTGHKRGRILQAYMSATSLVIRKSQFFDFSSRVDAHLDLFTRYMMGPLQGKTLILDSPDIKSNFAEKLCTIDRLDTAGIIK
ncbi:hypothetical protein TMatcc_010393 [Talaromyces marneffei ATCC 18224]